VRAGRVGEDFEDKTEGKEERRGETGAEEERGEVGREEMVLAGGREWWRMGIEGEIVICGWMVLPRRLEGGEEFTVSRPVSSSSMSLTAL